MFIWFLLSNCCIVEFIIEAGEGYGEAIVEEDWETAVEEPALVAILELTKLIKW